MLVGRLDHKGRVVLPLDARKALKVSAGDLVVFSVGSLGTWARTPVVTVTKLTGPEVVPSPTNR